MGLALTCLVASIFFFAVGTVGSSFKLFGLAEFDGKVQSRWIKLLSLLLGALFFVSFIAAFSDHSSRNQGEHQGGDQRREAPLNRGNPPTEDTRNQRQESTSPRQVDPQRRDAGPGTMINPRGPGALERLKP